MSSKTFEFPKAYEAKDTESQWYEFWEKRGAFGANPSSSKLPYCIVIPPPNVTGILHMGHALVQTLQDIMIRWKRMCGYEVLWVPGTDHAGIATQTVVERHLMTTTGKRRKDFSREEFLQHVWQWKENNEQRIITQLKRLGCSCDWSRQRFTMDEANNRSVRTIFKKMFDANLIYRGDYLVNWDPVTQTALADDEVEYEDRESFLWYFKYPLVEGSGSVTIATTRPETMLGDTAVAVSPKDDRFKDLVGKRVLLPLVNREIPIIADHYVDPEFGTGIVKITPAHDPNDYQIGQRHNLDIVNIMTSDAHINDNGGPFKGMSMEEARDAVVKAMEKEGLLEKIEPHINRVGVSYRSKATIEPYISKQWFVRMDPFRPILNDAIKQGFVKLIPKNFDNSYLHWIDNLRDWCISRQLWWGHRIPIWYRRDDPEKMLCYDGEGQPPEVEADPDAWVQDEDVLDTWFSSALWPFAALGWPDETPELQRFYPNSVLITGHDILFFWVARMILMGHYALNKVPFPEVFLHGLIYGKSYWRRAPDGGIIYVSDEERLQYDLGKKTPKDVISRWEKMSKSKGNVIDPLEIIEQYGTDAMRMALCSSATQARQIDLDRRKFEEFKNFTNKIWNGARFVFMNLESNDELGLPALTAESFSQGINESLLTLEDHWLLSTLNRIVNDVNKDLAAYRFDQSAIKAYDFFWKEFCAYYVEIAKPVLFGKVGTPEERENKQKLLVIALCNAIRLIHPMAPFVTEELFQRLRSRLEGVKPINTADPYTQETAKALQSEGCIVAPYPQVININAIDAKVNAAFDLVGRIVYTIRNIRGEMNLAPAVSTDVYIIGKDDDESLATIDNNQRIITALIRINKLEICTKEPPLKFACTGVSDDVKVIIPLPQEMIEQETSRLQKEAEKLKMSISKLQDQLHNEHFLNKAPPHLVDKQKQLLHQTETQLAEINNKLS